MSAPEIRAVVRRVGHHIFHINADRTIGHRGWQRCTKGCHPQNVWGYTVYVNGDYFESDNTGNWRVIYDAAHRRVTQARILAGLTYAPPGAEIRTI